LAIDPLGDLNRGRGGRVEGEEDPARGGDGDVARRQVEVRHDLERGRGQLRLGRPILEALSPAVSEPESPDGQYAEPAEQEYESQDDAHETLPARTGELAEGILERARRRCARKALLPLRAAPRPGKVGRSVEDVSMEIPFYFDYA
jgi:hypothetical protein